MDKILTVRQPYASALVCGAKAAEFRGWKITPGVRVWIHAGKAAGKSDPGAYFREIGDPIAADYFAWMRSDSDDPRPDIERSELARHMRASSKLLKSALPFGRIIGWCEFGEARPTEGAERTFGAIANPVVGRHVLAPEEWRIHVGALGLRPYNPEG